VILSFYERAIRIRYAFPLVVAAAVLLTTLNEWSYQHSRHTLRNGIALTDARLTAQRTLQLLTDAELAVRGQMVEGGQAHLEPFRVARRELPVASEATFKLIEEVDAERTIDVQGLRQQLTQRMADLARSVELIEGGQLDAARALVANDDVGQRTGATRIAMENLLAQAAARQQVARITLYENQSISRWLVHGLTFLVALGLYVFMRQVGRLDAARLREQQRLETQVAERTGELSELATYLMTAREDERGRLARELHDELGALLSNVKLDLARTRRIEGLPSIAVERLVSIDQRLNDGIALKRRIIENLRPSALEHLGLIDSLSLLCRESADVLGVPVHEDFEPFSMARDRELTVYRLVQEALTNVAKYAHASRVRVSCRLEGDEAVVEVSDDGRGFDPSVLGVGQHGLAGMRLRVEAHGGRIGVQSAPGGGTTVKARLRALPREAEPGDAGAAGLARATA
jgi:signal transduction histidine kinase